MRSMRSNFVDCCRPKGGPTMDITPSLVSTTSGCVPTKQNMAYEAFSLAAKEGERIYENWTFSKQFPQFFLHTSTFTYVGGLLSFLCLLHVVNVYVAVLYDELHAIIMSYIDRAHIENSSFPHACSIYHRKQVIKL